VGKTPIDFISSQLEEVANRGATDAGLEHLGNAFHTVEDFFAHSNFVELMQGDIRRGATLMTGNPVGPSQSVSPKFLRRLRHQAYGSGIGAIRVGDQCGGAGNPHGHGAR